MGAEAGACTPVPQVTMRSTGVVHGIAPPALRMGAEAGACTPVPQVTIRSTGVVHGIALAARREGARCGAHSREKAREAGCKERRGGKEKGRAGEVRPFCMVRVMLLI